MQWNKLAVVAALGAVVATGLTGCGKNTLATVGDDKITKDEFYNKLESVPVNGGPAGMVVLQQMIDEKLWMQLAKKEGVTPTEAQIDKRVNLEKKEGNLAQRLQASNISLEQYKKDFVTIQLAQFNVVTKGVKVTDAQARAYYDKTKSTVFTTPERVKIGAIVCQTKKKIDTANGQIKKGTDFSSVVLNLSDDPTLRSRRVPGELGWVWRGQKNVPAQLVDVAFKLRKGELSEPFQVVVNGKAADWVIIRCLDHQGVNVKPFNDVKDQIRDGLALATGQRNPEIGKKFQAMRKDTKMETSNDKYKALVTAMKKTDDKKK